MLRVPCAADGGDEGSLHGGALGAAVRHHRGRSRRKLWTHACAGVCAPRPYTNAGSALQQAGKQPSPVVKPVPPCSPHWQALAGVCEQVQVDVAKSVLKQGAVQHLYGKLSAQVRLTAGLPAGLFCLYAKQRRVRHGSGMLDTCLPTLPSC